MLLVSLKIVAQTANFSGTWILKERISVSGLDYDNGLPTRLKVDQRNDSIIIERLNINGSGNEYTIIESMSLDGEPTVISRPGNRKRTSAVKWSDDQHSLIETVNYYKPLSKSEIDFTFTERWIFDRSNHVTIEKNQQGPSGDKWAMKGIYKLKSKESMAKGKGIPFLNGLRWDEVKAKAKKENKYIFVDAYATWCKPCKEMEREIFPLNIVGTAINEQFIAVRLQMDTTKKDNEEVQAWYTTAHNFLNEYKIIGYPTFLFFDPNGNIVHKGLGIYKADGFIELLKAALDPRKQYYTLLNRLQRGKKDYDNIDYLIITAKKLGETLAVESLLKEYQKNYLAKLPQDSLMTESHLKLAAEFEEELITAYGSKGFFFKLLYKKGKQVDDILDRPDFSSFHVNGIISKEEIWDKVYRNGQPIGNPQWQKIKTAINTKYPNVNVEKLLLDGQIKYYRATKDWNNQIKYLVRKIDKYGPLSVGQSDGSGSDNTIANALLPHCDDKQILTKAIGWMEAIIKSNAYMYPIPMVYGNYGGILYKAGKHKEGIAAFERHLNAVGYKGPGDLAKYSQFKSKIEILEKMKRGEKIDSSWNIEAFF